MLSMLMLIQVGNEDIVKVDKDAIQPPGVSIHHMLKCSASVLESNRHSPELWKRPKGVMMAILGNSLGTTGIWCCP